MQEEKIKKCYKIFLENNILSNNPIIFKQNFARFALKNHPDKGGDSELFSIINDCRDILLNDFESFIYIATKPKPTPKPIPKPIPI